MRYSWQGAGRALAAAIFLTGIVGAATVLAWPAKQASAQTCVTTRSIRPNESCNPHYRPGAPVRSSIGKGHVLVGVVRASQGCRPIGRALEFFQAGPRGYSTTSWAGRATVFSRTNGSYSFEGPLPSNYGGRPHIHLRVSAPGFVQLNTTYFVRAGATRGRLDLVLPPEG